MSAALAAFRSLVRYWRRHRLQALLCLVGVVLGVAVFCAIQLANRGALQAYSEGMERFLGRATHRIYAPGGARLSEDFFVRLIDRPGVLAAAPVLTGRLSLSEEAGLPLTLLGLDLISDGAFREQGLLENVGLDSRADPMAMLEVLLARPNAVLVPAALARQRGLATGGRLAVNTSAGPRSLLIAGIFHPPPHQARAFSRTLLADIATHQEVFGRLGELDFITLKLAPRAARALSRDLPPGLKLEPAGSAQERVREISRAFRLNLEVLGLFGLLVAMFLIFNAATFSVVQRQRSLSILRCLGSGARPIFAAVLAEAVLLGAAGGALGVLLGGWLGAVMVENTGATFFEVVLNADPLPAQVALDGYIWAAGLGLGISASVAGSLHPALAAAGTGPLAALRSARSPAAPSPRGMGWLAAGLALWLVSAVLLAAPGRSLVAGLAGATGLAVGGAALCLPALWLTSRVGRKVLGVLFGVPGRLAADQLQRGLSRSGLATASLMIAISLALAITVTVRSFRATFEVWLSQAVTADLYLAAGDGEHHRPLSPGLLAQLKAQPYVRELTVLRSQQVVLPGREITVLGIQMPGFADNTVWHSRDGTQEEIFARMKAGQIFVSEALAYPLGLRRGGRLRLPTPAGERPFTIGAVVQNYTAPQGLVYMDSRQFEAVFGPRQPRRAAIWLRSGVELSTAADAVRALAGTEPLTLTENAHLRANALRIFNRTFLITEWMGALAAFVAFIAVVSALTALLEERMRVLGTLRAIGLSARRLGLAMLLEALLLALTASLVAWVTGLLMAAVVVFVINRRAFGWTLQFLPGEGPYLWLLVLALGAAALGSLYPIRRATRLSVTATIREE